MQNFSTLSAISPIDVRYRNPLNHLSDYFSELALMRYRVHIEVEYFIALSTIKFFTISSAQIK